MERGIISGIGFSAFAAVAVIDAMSGKVFWAAFWTFLAALNLCSFIAERK